MPVLESAVGVRGQEGVAQGILVGVAGQTGHGRAVRPHQHVLDVLCVQAGVLWLALTTLMKPVEQPAAT